MGKRKYEEVKGYWVYSIKIPSNNMYYIGVSKTQCSRRWIKASYQGTALELYLNEWQDMVKNVLVDNLSSKEEALKMEDNIIRGLKMSNLCINEQRSGLITNDINAYTRELRKANSEYQEYQKHYYEDNKEKINQRKKQRYENDVEFREQEKQRKKQWYENNKEKKREYDKQHYEKNKERIKQRENQYKKQRYQTDSEYRERKKEYQRQYMRQYRLKKKQKQNSLPLT